MAAKGPPTRVVLPGIHVPDGHAVFAGRARASAPDVIGGVPGPLNSVMGRWMQESAPWLDGVYYSNYTDYDLFEASNTCLFFHLAWNPRQDAEAILSDYYAKAYGPAAGEIRAMEEAFETLMRTRVLGPTLPTRAEIWETIYTDETIAPFQQRMERALAAARGTPFETRVRLFKEHYLGSFLAEREKYFERLNLGNEMVLCAAPAAAPLSIDGRLDEPAWARAPRGTMVSIQDLVRATVEIEVRLLYDERNLYVGMTCQEPAMDRLRTVFTTPDDTNMWQDDEVEVFLDTARTRTGYYQWMVNAAGAMADLHFHARAQDIPWDSKARVAVLRAPQAWSVEMSIPFAAMNVSAPQPGERWIANFCRARALNDPQPGERQFLSWSRLVKGGFQKPAAFGRILFTRDGKAEPDTLNRITNGDFEAPPGES